VVFCNELGKSKPFAVTRNNYREIFKAVEPAAKAFHTKDTWSRLDHILLSQSFNGSTLKKKPFRMDVTLVGAGETRKVILIACHLDPELSNISALASGNISLISPLTEDLPAAVGLYLLVGIFGRSTDQDFKDLRECMERFTASDGLSAYSKFVDHYKLKCHGNSQLPVVERWSSWSFSEIVFLSIPEVPKVAEVIDDEPSSSASVLEVSTPIPDLIGAATQSQLQPIFLVGVDIPHQQPTVLPRSDAPAFSNLMDVSLERISPPPMLPDRTPIVSTIRQATSPSVLRPSFLSFGILCALARHKSPYADRFGLLTIDGGKEALCYLKREVQGVEMIEKKLKGQFYCYLGCEDTGINFEKGQAKSAK